MAYRVVNILDALENLGEEQVLENVQAFNCSLSYLFRGGNYQNHE